MVQVLSRWRSSTRPFFLNGFGGLFSIHKKFWKELLSFRYDDVIRKILGPSKDPCGKKDSLWWREFLGVCFLLGANCNLFTNSVHCKTRNDTSVRFWKNRLFRYDILCLSFPKLLEKVVNKDVKIADALVHTNGSWTQSLNLRDADLIGEVRDQLEYLLLILDHPLPFSDCADTFIWWRDNAGFSSNSSYVEFQKQLYADFVMDFASLFGLDLI